LEKTNSFVLVRAIALLYSFSLLQLSLLLLFERDEKREGRRFDASERKGVDANLPLPASIEEKQNTQTYIRRSSSSLFPRRGQSLRAKELRLEESFPSRTCPTPCRTLLAKDFQPNPLEDVIDEDVRCRNSFSTDGWPKKEKKQIQSP